MTVVALVHPSGLLGTELRETLSRRRELWRELRLLSDDEDEVGNLTEIAGEAAMVAQISPEEGFEGVDVAFFCGSTEQTRGLIDHRPPGTSAVVMSPGAGPEDGLPIVAGVNLDGVQRGAALLSPHPGAVALAHLVKPLTAFGVERVTATLIQPASVHGREALDEVLEQTRAILNFAPEQAPKEIFPVQMAFNVIPSREYTDHLPGLVRTILGFEGDVAVQVLQAGAFHSYGISLHLSFYDDPGTGEISEALAFHPLNDQAVDPELLGLIDAAAREELIVGPVEADPLQPGAYWIWAVMDNLTLGGAQNAVQILEALTGVVN